MVLFSPSFPFLLPFALFSLASQPWKSVLRQQLESRVVVFPNPQFWRLDNVVQYLGAVQLCSRHRGSEPSQQVCSSHRRSPKRSGWSHLQKTISHRKGNLHLNRSGRRILSCAFL